MADSAADAWVIAGLGNPGPEYEQTPHNLGFMAVDRLAGRHGIRVTRKESQSLTGVGRIDGREVFLAKPMTYMNRSGPAVKSLLARQGLGPERLVLVYDELALPWLSLRIRPQGSAGGHNGVSSVISALGTNEFPRVRLGIHPGHPISNTVDFVLGPLRRAQLEELDPLLDIACEAVESILAEGVEMAMTRHNRRAPG